MKSPRMRKLLPVSNGWKLFHNVANRRDGCKIGTVVEVKKEIPVNTIEIADYATGPTSVEIPYAKIRDLIRPEFPL